MHNTDVIIIGAGPVGLFTVFQAGMLGAKCHVIDSLDVIGGQCNALYAEKPIYDIPAYPKILAGELIEKLMEQAARFNPVFHLGEQVIAYEKDEDGFVISTDKNTKIAAKVIIIAAGCGVFGPNRPPLENIREYEGKSVFYSVQKISDFEGKKIAIAGGGDSAIDWAINLSKVAEKIYLIHRRDKFRASPATLEEVANIAKTGKIEYIVPYQLHSLEGNDEILSSVNVYDQNNNIKSLDANILLPFFGLSMDLGPLRNWGLGISANNIEVAQSTCMTNLPGIYAVGDIATYEGKLKLILTGFAEGASALHHAYSKIFDGKALHFEYSTSKGGKSSF